MALDNEPAALTQHCVIHTKLITTCTDHGHIIIIIINITIIIIIINGNSSSGSSGRAAATEAEVVVVVVVVEAVPAVRSSSSANFRKMSDGHYIPYGDLKELA